MTPSSSPPPPSLPFLVSSPETTVSATPNSVVVLGGTLGILLGLRLQTLGLNVTVVESRAVEGREQDWNVAANELESLKLLLGEGWREEVDVLDFHESRAQFKGGEEWRLPGVLSCGIKPRQLIAACKRRFEELGGVTLEYAPASSALVGVGGVRVSFREGRPAVEACLLVDCTGQGSPITRQVRAGEKANGACVVVGTLAGGHAPSFKADLIKSIDDVVPVDGGREVRQYFWESFPSTRGGDLRTTYMFSYVDCEPGRGDLESHWRDYVERLPAYAGGEHPGFGEGKTVQECMDDGTWTPVDSFTAVFKTYKNSPLRIPYDRVVSVGDASGASSPLSFGGLGAMLRFLPRYGDAIKEAVDCGVYSSSDLSMISPYDPGKSATWMFQRALSPRPGEPEKAVNRLMNTNYQCMMTSPIEVWKSFNQDVLRFESLAAVLGKATFEDPGNIPGLVWRCRGEIVPWVAHVAALGVYGALGGGKEGPRKGGGKEGWRRRRRWEAWRYGGGADYHV